MSNNKFRIRKRTPEQGNYTGHPWLIDFPPGHKSASNGYSAWTTDGAAFDDFEQARKYMAYRLNEEARMHRGRVASARRLVAAEDAK